MRRTWRALAMPLVLAALIYPASLLSGDSPGSEAAPGASTDDDLRTLAERLLSQPGPGPGTSTVALMPGQIPSSFPVPLPVPAGGRLVGSAIRGDGSRQQSIDVVMDAPGRPSETMAALRRSLAQGGWLPLPYGPGGAFSGFRPTSVSEYGGFCEPTQAQWLTLSLTPRSGGGSDVRAHVERSGGPCAAPPTPAPAAAVGVAPVPALDPPDGSNVQPGYGGGRMQSDAVAESALTPAQLEQHYAAQLQAAGWTRQAGADAGSFAWSTWRPAGQADAIALLHVLALPGSNRRDLHLAVNLGGAQGPLPPMPSGRPPPFPPYPMPPPGGPAPTATPALVPGR